MRCLTAKPTSVAVKTMPTAVQSPPKSLAERGVGQSDEHEREDRVHARFVNQRPVTAADFVEREALVQCVPGSGTQIRVPLETDGERRDCHHTGCGLAAPEVEHSQYRTLLETRQLNVHAQRFADPA